MPHSLPPAVVLCRMAACALLALSTSSSAQDVPVPQQSYTTAQLYQPLRTFTTAEIGILPTQVGIHHGFMVVSGGRQGGTGGDPTGYGKLTMWRLSQPSAPNVVNPSLVGQILNDNIYKSHVMGFSGEKVALRTNKVTIFDLTNPAAPTAMGTATGGHSSSHSSCWAGKYIYTCGEGYGTASGWLDIYDASNPNTLTLIRSVDLPTITGFRCASVFVLGNQLVVSASLTNGVATFDLSDPTNPLLISVFRGDTGANTYTSYLSGYRLYGGGQAGGLYIYDVSDSQNIKLVDHVTTLGGTPRYPVLQDEFIHLGNLGNGHYQKIRIDTVPAQIVADVAMPIPAGASKANTEIAIPIGNLVYVGCINGANPGTPITYPAGFIIPHDTVPDTRPPAVNGVRPLDGETNVAPTSMIGVSFTDLLNTPSISNASIIVRPVGGAALAGTYSNMGGIVNFAPSTPLAANTTYEIVVKGGGVKDYSGNAFAADQIYRFSTGSSIDTTTLGLALSYPLDETTGTTADDTLGAHNGTLTNFPASPWSAGIVGAGSLNFDGAASYVAVPSIDVGSAFSFSTWVRANSGSANLETIAANAAGGFATAGFRLFVYGSAHASYPGRVQFETGDGTNGNAANTAIGALPFDQWVHLAVTVDRAAGAAHIYINGIDQTADSSIVTGFPTAAPITLGRMSTASYFFDGGMDDFRLYSRILAPADIDQLRDLCVSPIGHWGFNNTTADAAPNGRPVTLSAAGTTYDATQANEGGWSLSLNGSTGNATTPSLELGNSFTLAAWVRIPSGNGGLNTLIANGPSGYIGNGFNFYVTGSTNATPGKIQFETGNGTAGNDAHTAANAFPFDQWVHVAVGVDRARGTALIYVNGKDVTADNTIRTDFKTAGAMDVGSMTNNSNYLAGNIDDLRVYPRWLGDNEIGTLAIGKLLAYWRFDGAGADESGFARTATLLNGAGYSTDAVRGSESMSLDGIDSGLDDHAEVSAFDVGNQFSISLWAKLTTTVAGTRTLLANSAGGSATNGMRFFVNSWNTNDGRILFETGNGTLSDAAGSATGVFQPNQWNHIAVVVDRAAGHADLYYNRRLVTSDSTIRPDFATNLLLYIGRLATSANFNGQIDDFRIYAKKLTTNDIGVLGEGSPDTSPTVSNLASSASAATTGTGLTFTATASDPNFGDALSYRFDFGDGTNTAWTSNNTAVHTFNTPGRYSVTVFVSDGTATQRKSMTQIVYNALTSLPPSISAEMAYDPSRNKVWCVVPDGDGASPAGGRVVRFDANTRGVDYRVALGANTDPVALALRPGNAEVWVACKQSDQVIVIDANAGTVLATLPIGHGYEPTGVAFAPDGSAAFVTCEGSESIQKWSPTARTKTLEVDLGAAPRGLAVASDSSRIFVTRFRSPDTQGQVWELAAAGLTLTRTFTLSLDTTTPDSPSSARGLPNYLSQVVVSPDGQRAWLPGKKDNILRGKYRDGQDLNHENTVRAYVGQLNLTTSSPNPNAEILANRVDLDNTGLPVSACFSPHGDLVFVSVIANEEVAIIDANSRATQPAISTADDGQVLGYAPNGLCVSPDGSKLFVHNFLERKVRVFDISQLTAGTGSTAALLGTVSLVVTEPLAANILQGKKLFYNSEDPRLALEGYISCVSCHLHGDSDGRIWDLGTFGEGLRKTIDLRGHAGMSMGLLHWSGNFDEVQDFENQIRSLSGGAGLISGGTPNPPLGASNAGRSADLDALAAYVASLNVIPKSPYRNPDGTNTASAINGQADFNAKGCATCHSGVQFTDSTLTAPFIRHDMGTITASSGQRLGGTLDGLDTPTLRGIWGTYPYLHRGQAADLPSVFNTTNAPAGKGHDRFRELTTTQQNDLIRYLLELE